MLKSLQFSLCLILALACVDLRAQDWYNAATMNDAREAPAAVLLESGQVLICGGGVDLQSASASADLYDYRSDQLVKAADMPRPLLAHEAIRLPGRGVLVAGGGISTDQPENHCVVYDPANDRWTAAAPMLQRRQNFSLLQLHDGRIMALGGLGGDPGTSGWKSLASCEIYDPETDSWAYAADMMTPRNDFAAIVLESGQVLAPNGYSTESEYSQACELYDVEQNTWTSTGAFLHGGSGAHAMTLLNDGRVLRTGGWPGPKRVSELYDPSTDE